MLNKCKVTESHSDQGKAWQKPSTQEEKAVSSWPVSLIQLFSSGCVPFSHGRDTFVCLNLLTVGTPVCASFDTHIILVRIQDHEESHTAGVGGFFVFEISLKSFSHSS